MDIYFQENLNLRNFRVNSLQTSHGMFSSCVILLTFTSGVLPILYNTFGIILGLGFLKWKIDIK